VQKHEQRDLLRQIEMLETTIEEKDKMIAELKKQVDKGIMQVCLV
jgi:predicted RNase H-like nuclease (RuvC/YqgF family)